MRIDEETHGSDHRYRCSAGVSCACRGGLCTDNDCGQFFHDDECEQLEWHKLAARAVLRTAARTDSGQESDLCLPQQRSEARARQMVQATPQRPEDLPSQCLEPGVLQLVKPVASEPEGQAAEHNEPNQPSALEKNSEMRGVDAIPPTRAQRTPHYSHFILLILSFPHLERNIPRTKK